eukprot:2472136-Rhodomonas_salina.2
MAARSGAGQPPPSFLTAPLCTPSTDAMPGTDTAQTPCYCLTPRSALVVWERCGTDIVQTIPRAA